MHIAIIGNGISGITAARHLRKLTQYDITVISAESEYFFSRTALMYVYMGHMKFEHTQPYEPHFWKKNRINLKKGYVQQVNFKSKKLHFEDGELLAYDKLILACGSTPNRFGWPGQDLTGVQGLYSYQDLESMEAISPTVKHAVIVGGGLIGIEMAEMFHSRHIPVTLLVREPSFWSKVLPPGESAIVNREIQRNGINLRLEEELDEILPDKQGNVAAIRTKNNEVIDCQFVGLTVGVHPNIHFLQETAVEIDRGILIDEYMQTNLPDVYAIGDCAQHRRPPKGRRPVEQVWYTGRMMGEVVAKNIAGQSVAYTPGPWFNSAKFIDIEYQTYGTVQSSNPKGVSSLYWEHEDGKKCIHIAYDTASQVVYGINTFGIRHRHEVWDQWLKQEKTLRHVVENLHQANFDPEFFKVYETEIVSLYNQQFPHATVKPKRKRRFLEWLGLG